MLFKSQREYNDLIRSLNHDYKRHFVIGLTDLSFGSNWSDVTKAVFLVCNKWFWGNSPRQFRAGPTVKYPPAALSLVERRINPLTGTGGCIFHVKGDTNYLVTLLKYQDKGMLYADRGKGPGTWDFERDKFLSAIMEAREKARKVKRNLAAV